jgi:Protein of Unknown function (DUF2604)
VAKITVNCVINGKTVSESVEDHAALQALIEDVLKDAKATARPADDWTVRLAGAPLDHHKGLSAQGIVAGATLFFSLGGSESGAA